MDPLTHTLVGANLGATRLATKTRLAAAALVIGANAPDIDSIYYFTGQSDFALFFRRGWTHGVLAWVILPLVQTALLMLYARLRPDPARPVNARWLLMLSAIGVATHPLLDWLNTYGIRLLMPFRGTWFYGDAVYIMDPWLWLILGTGWLLGRKASVVTVGLWLFFALAIARVVNGRSPEYLPLIALVFAILFIALLLPLTKYAQRAATVASIIAALYVGARITISAQTAQRVRAALERTDVPSIERVMVSPHPLDPRQWGWVAETGSSYRYGTWDWRGDAFTVDEERVAKGEPSQEFETAKRDPAVRGFVTWWRFPGHRTEREAGETRVHLFDARRLARGRGDLSDRIVIVP